MNKVYLLAVDEHFPTWNKDGFNVFQDWCHVNGNITADFVTNVNIKIAKVFTEKIGATAWGTVHNVGYAFGDEIVKVTSAFII